MPGLIEFVAQSAGMVEGGTLPDTRLAALNEVWKAFSLFFASVPEDLREWPGLRLDWASIHDATSRCPIAVCVAANGDAGPRSELCAAVHATHARHNAPTIICDISTNRLQGSYRDTTEHDEGYIGAIDKTSG